MLSKIITVPIKAILFALLLACSFVNADWKLAYDAYEARDLKKLKILTDGGDADARFMLGYMYQVGRGVIKDYKQAVKWYTLAAEQGNSDAQLNLGFMYGKGEGVIQDYVMAHMFANIAASNGAPSENRDLIAKKITPSQLEQSQQKAREWIEKHGN